MSGTASVIKLTKEEFRTLRPLNGHVIVKSSKDMSTMTFKGLILEVDVTFKPENHQEVFSTIVKVPRSSYTSVELRSSIQVKPGDKVLINYFPILQAPVLIVEGDMYRMVPYCWVIGRITSPTGINQIEMLNDFILVDKIEEPQSALELAIHKKHSKIYYEVIVANRNDEFSYFKRSNSLLWPVEGDIVVLRDMAVFALESAGHYYFDGEPHYVAKAWKVVSIVEPSERMSLPK